MKSPLDYIRHWRYGGQTGQDVWSAEGRMVAFGIGPVLGIWILVSIAAPLMLDPLSAHFVDQAMPIIVMGGLVANLALMKARATEDANSLELALPYTAWRFPDGSIHWFDLKIPREGIEEVCDFPDGGKGVHVNFLEKYEWTDKKLNRTYVWQSANWRLPSSLSNCFKRLGSGQLFHKNIFVNHNSCEAVTVYVKEFVETEQGWEPVCKIQDSAYDYDQFLNGQNPSKHTEDPRDSLWFMAFKRTQKAFGSAMKHTENLEERLVIAEQQGPRDFKEAADNRLKAIRSRHAGIMNTAEPLTSRLFKLIFNWKTIVALGVVVLILWYIGVLRF
jgi:hypothetical protein